MGAWADASFWSGGKAFFAVMDRGDDVQADRAAAFSLAIQFGPDRRLLCRVLFGAA
jgi:hypothetical protein